MKHYSDYFKVPQGYRPMMTREEINERPDKWLDFFPHKDFEVFCSTLLAALQAGDKSVWMTGNLGTGKSNAVLVLQKLFMDDEVRVRRWLEREDGKGLADRQSLEENLFLCRDEGTFVVFDYNSAGVAPNEGLLVRLEKVIIAALKEKELIVPTKSNLDSIKERISREGAHFFATRDRIQKKLEYLIPGIKTAEKLIDALDKEHKETDAPTKLLDDVQRVLHEDNIYLDVSAPTFRAWIKSILADNNLNRIVYIFDEFHPFIEANKDQLKTFEDVTESPGVNRFFLVPVTHMQINAYVAEGSETVKRANDRFYFRKLTMPNDTAFCLAHRAMEEDKELLPEWNTERNNLWTSISSIVDKFTDSEDPKRDSFYNILPIHPMAAFLLKHLSESAKSNQRSLFEYLKGGADDKEFQDFIRTGGPEVANKQFLTADYLWNFFINREDLGHSSDITDVGIIYKQIYDREFSNQTEDAAELRVLKAVLLFCLLERLSPSGHDRLKPTVENIELSFRGDGVITDPAGIVKDLADKHCFSVVGENIELYTSSVGGPELLRKIAEQETKFHEILSDKLVEMFEKHTNNHRQCSSGRFEIRVSDASHTTPGNITTSVKERYGKGHNKDNASVCLWFVVAKNKEEQLLIPERIERTLTQLRDHRILMFTFPTLTFCHKNVKLWNDYVRQYAGYLLENNDAAKKSIMATLTKLENEWFEELKQTTSFKVYSMKNEKFSTAETSWSGFRELIESYVRTSLPCCIDHLTQQITVFGITGLKTWASVGIAFNAASGQHGQLVKGLQNKGITSDEDWFLKNSDHPLSRIHTLFEKKIANTIAKGGQLSVRKVYIELQRAPFGMRYNALSAFVLGFVLRGLLSKNYQWTNGQMTRPLEADTLAEIIESVVKNDGKENMPKEKLICRLSKYAKAFVEKAPLMFGMPPIPDSTVENVLAQIQTSIERTSAHVPLWALSEYIHAVGGEKAETVSALLVNICKAFPPSSKGGRTEERTDAIEEVGKAILAHPEIVALTADYIKRENFLKAFEIYVDKTNPMLSQIAREVGDVSHHYSRAILDKTAETAGWLWNKVDVSKEIDEIQCEYETIALAKNLLGHTEFMPYNDVLSAFKTAVTQSNCLPKQMIEAEYPVLANFHLAVRDGGNTQYIKSALSQSAEIIEKLFFSTNKTESLKILKSRIGEVSFSDNDLLGILNSMSGGFGLDESMFLDGVRTKVEEYLKQSVVQNIKGEWARLSGTTTPSDWAINNRIPTRFLFNGIAETDDIIKAIEQPDTFAASRLTDLLDILRDFSPLSISECQNAFLLETIPSKYAKFNISLAPLLEFLLKKYGEQPNNWMRPLDISDFVRIQYKNTFAPQIAEKIRSKPAEELKQRLIDLAKEDEELGLMFWEV